MQRLILVALLVVGCGGPAPSDAPGTAIWQMSDAQRELYLEGCPGPSPVCDQEPELSNGLECWSLEAVRWCRPVR